MKKGLKTIILLGSSFVMVLLAGFTAGKDSDRDMISFAADPPKQLLETKYGEANSSAAAVAGGANDFAFRLSAALAEKNGNENFVCSPYSVWVPLAALVGATDDPNKEALLTALHASGISEADINQASSRMLYDLTKQREQALMAESDYPFHNPLQIANAVFVDHDVTLNQDFARDFTDYFRGTAMNVDFASKDAADAVNQWASENTEGLITEIVQQFDPDTVAALANAIYFSDQWGQKFDPDKTTESTFHSPNGETKAFYMRREGDSQTYYEDDKVQAMPLRFQTGGGLYIILPKDGNASKLMSAMTHDYFEEIGRDSIKATGTLLLPRFSIDSGMELKDTLTALGVPLFDEQKAPLTGGLIKEEIPVWLSSASHKAVIKVDEKGTTAAAVTVMAAATSAMPIPTEPFEMICNKPFIFVLYENTYDGGQQVLFTGIVNQP